MKETRGAQEVPREAQLLSWGPGRPLDGVRTGKFEGLVPGPLGGGLLGNAQKYLGELFEDG